MRTLKPEPVAGAGVDHALLNIGALAGGDEALAGFEPEPFRTPVLQD